MYDNANYLSGKKSNIKRGTRRGGITFAFPMYNCNQKYLFNVSVPTFNVTDCHRWGENQFGHLFNTLKKMHLHDMERRKIKGSRLTWTKFLDHTYTYGAHTSTLHSVVLLSWVSMILSQKALTHHLKCLQDEYLAHSLKLVLMILVILYNINSCMKRFLKKT